MINSNPTVQKDMALNFTLEWWLPFYFVRYPHLFLVWRFIPWVGLVFGSWWYCCLTSELTNRWSSSSLLKSAPIALWSSRSFWRVPFLGLCFCQLFSSLSFITTWVCHLDFGFAPGTLLSSSLSFRGFPLYGSRSTASSDPTPSFVLSSSHGDSHTALSFTIAIIKFPISLPWGSSNLPGTAGFFALAHWSHCPGKLVAGWMSSSRTISAPLMSGGQCEVYAVRL